MTKKYQIIYADPPWHYEQGVSSTRGAAHAHYSTMSTQDICNLPIKDIKTDDAICFMWATFPKLPEAFKVMEAWGFIYKTAGFVWLKKNKKANTNFWGMGSYTRSNAEICLLGISKNTKEKQMVKANNIHQIIESPIEAHSKKPDIVRHKIIELLGDLPRIELFARQQTEGWDVFGNEVNNSININK